jgi:histidinol-phosphate phosphatase family protein
VTARVPAIDSRAAVFVDKDGTLVENVPYNADPARVRFTPHAGAGLRRLADAGLSLFIATNQPALSTGHIDPAQFARLQRAIEERLLDEAGVRLAGWLVCPHAATLTPPCGCRKPAPGLLQRAAREHGIDLARSWMVGDILDDVEAGQRAGCRTVLLDVGSETVWRTSPLRTPHHRVANWLEAARAIIADDESAAGHGPDHALAEHRWEPT